MGPGDSRDSQSQPLNKRAELESWTESGAHVILMICHRWEDFTGCGMFTYAFLFHVLPTLYLTRMTTTIKPKQITSSTAVMKVKGPVLPISYCTENLYSVTLLNYK